MSLNYLLLLGNILVTKKIFLMCFLSFAGTHLLLSKSKSVLWIEDNNSVMLQIFETFLI